MFDDFLPTPFNATPLTGETPPNLFMPQCHTADLLLLMVERFMRAYVNAAAAYDVVFQPKDAATVKPADKEALLAIIAKYTELTPQQVLESLNYIDPTARLDVEDIRRQIAAWKALGMVEPATEADAMIDLSFLSPAPPPR